MVDAAFHLRADELTDAREGRFSPEHLAKLLVSKGVARDAAVGWAVRTDAGWVRGAGRASASLGPLSQTPTTLEFDPIFDLASLTKPMTALALARSGCIARGARLGDVLEEARGSISEDVTLEHLLAHRGGLEAHVSLYEPLMSPGAVLDRSSALRRVANARRADAPGAVPIEGFAPVYSDLGYALVGEALARAERSRDAGEVIERSVAEAIGVRDLGTARGLSARPAVEFASRVRPTEVVDWRGGVVQGAVHDENAWALTGTGGSGHAGMFGTIDAVLEFGCAVFDAIERREGPLSAERGDLGWLVRPRPGGSLRAGFDGKSESGSSAGQRAGPRTVGHLGFTGTSVWIDPDAQAVVSILTNRVHPSRDNVAIRAARPVVHDALFALAAATRRVG